MLKLTYTRARDEFQTVTVLGDPAGIRDLYWQLTHNYQAQAQVGYFDGSKIGTVKITNLDGMDCTDTVMANPFGYCISLSNIDR